jgi:hypothetical protein
MIVMVVRRPRASSRFMFIENYSISFCARRGRGNQNLFRHCIRYLRERGGKKINLILLDCIQKLQPGERRFACRWFYVFQFNL